MRGEQIMDKKIKRRNKIFNNRTNLLYFRERTTII